MPALAAADLERLGAYLTERLSPDPQQWAGTACDDTLRLTSAWLEAHGLDVAAFSVEFAQANIYCDCSVLLNLVLPAWWPAPQITG